MGAVSRFEIDIPAEVIEDLRLRLINARLPEPGPRTGWVDGVDMEVLGELVDWWGRGYDWSAVQAALNELPHRCAATDGLRLHFVHQARGGDDLPLLLLHGWPQTFLQMLPLARRLVATPAGRASFQTVIPSLPGFGFSERPVESGWNLSRIADELHRLMVDVLGLTRYGVRGSDWGLSLALILGARYPDHVVGVHIGASHLRVEDLPQDASASEREFVVESLSWYGQEGAYNDLQATKPQTIGTALNDSPAGLLAWILEKHRTWSVPSALFDVFSRDEILTTATIYWVTQTITSSARLYREEHLQPTAVQPVRCPLAISQPALEEYRTPESWWRRHHPTAVYSVMPSTAHFPERENPDAMAESLAAFFGPLA